jgi:glycopeptide antibiotics resistance protein
VSRPTLWLLAVAAVAVVAVVVFLPTSRVPAEVVHIISRELHHAGAPRWAWDPTLWERLLNVVLFMPVGFFGVMLRPRWPLWAWAVVGLVASLTIETVQMAMPGRDGSAWDVVTNTTGALVGAFLARGALSVWSARRQPG